MLAALALAFAISLPLCARVAAPAPSWVSPGVTVRTQSWRSDLPWATDFAEAHEKARASTKPILAYIPKYATDHMAPNFERFESGVLSTKSFAEFADGFVLYLVERGKTDGSMPIGARAIEHNAQSVVLLDSDGWALSRVGVRFEEEGGHLPALNQIKDLAKPATDMRRVRERAAKGEAKAKEQWLTWAASSGQLTDLEDARAQLAALKVPESADKRAAVEVAVIINAAQAAANKPLVQLTKAEKGSIGARLWPYFAKGYRPEDDTRDWAYLWCALQHAGETGDARGYEKAKSALQKKGPCGQMDKEMEETLARLRKGKQANG